MKRIVRWAVRFFFASSVGFAVPVSEMIDPASIGKGLALGVVPCISMKIVSGAFAYVRYASEEARQRSRSASWATRYLHAQPQQLLVGMAMVARGEFAYMVAETAYVAEYVDGAQGETMMSREVYASVVWALVGATIASPLLFRWALGVYGRATPIVRSRSITTARFDPTDLEAASLMKSQGAATGAAALESASGKSFRIRIGARHHVGVQVYAPVARPHALLLACRMPAQLQRV